MSYDFNTAFVHIKHCNAESCFNDFLDTDRSHRALLTPVELGDAFHNLNTALGLLLHDIQITNTLVCFLRSRNSLLEPLADHASEPEDGHDGLLISCATLPRFFQGGELLSLDQLGLLIFELNIRFLQLRDKLRILNGNSDLVAHGSEQL